MGVRYPTPRQHVSDASGELRVEQHPRALPVAGELGKMTNLVTKHEQVRAAVEGIACRVGC